MDIHEFYLTNNKCFKTNRKIIPSGLMLHSIGFAQPNARSLMRSWNNPHYGCAVHAVIDANSGEVFQLLPWNHRAWHCGGEANNTHISVEMAEPDAIIYTGGASFVVANIDVARKQATTAYNSAVDLFAFLCKKFDLDPLNDIISHSEGYSLGLASNHADPVHLWKGLKLPYTMDGFREDVRFAMREIPELVTANDIIWEFGELGIIKDKELWALKFQNESNEYWLGRKAVNYIRHNCSSDLQRKIEDLTEVNDIIWELSHIGIITDKEFWFKKLEEDNNCYWFARKIVNYIRCH